MILLPHRNLVKLQLTSSFYKCGKNNGLWWLLMCSPGEAGGRKGIFPLSFVEIIREPGKSFGFLFRLLEPAIRMFMR
jgi:hypothetical protein